MRVSLLFVILPAAVSLLSTVAVIIGYRFWQMETRLRDLRRASRFRNMSLRVEITGDEGGGDLTREMPLREAFESFEKELRRSRVDPKTVRTVLDVLERSIQTTERPNPAPAYA